MTDREAFEAFCCKRWGGDRGALHLRDMQSSERFGEYVSGHVEFAWCAWQAAVAVERADRDRVLVLQKASYERELAAEREACATSPALRRAAQRTREDLGATGTNYPDVRELLAFAEAAIARDAAILSRTKG